MITRSIISVVAILLIHSLSIAGNIRISVKDEQNLPLIGATIQVTNVSDSTLVFNITDQHGIALFDNIENGLYSIKITYVGFRALERSISVRDGAREFNFRMEPDALNLGEVTITAARPLIRQEGDRMIIDPEPLTGISTNTLEILESTPGLYVDQDGGIFLSSATPAAVYINGREQKMSSQDINTILRSLPPNSVDRIEVIRTPSTRYDAASSGGIVNIILKRGMRIGRFGSVNAGMNQGVYGNRFAGFSFNNSGDRSTSYIMFNYNYNDMLEELNSVRFLDNMTQLDQDASTRRRNNQAYVGYGINYDIRDNVNFSYDGRFNSSARRTNANNFNLIEGVDDILGESENLTNTDNNFLSIQQDLGLMIQLDTLGSVLDTKLGYSYGGNDVQQDYSTEFFIPFSTENFGKGESIQNRHFLVFQSDLTYMLPLDITLETGVKSSLQRYDSDAEFWIRQNNQFIDDTLRTNAFNYEESISAAYLQVSRDIGLGFHLKTGVRFEHTYMDGNQLVPADTNFRINRADFFPYVFLSRRLVKLFDQIELTGFMIYRRTINRPGYQSLNPYISFVDQFLYETGNPALKPQFTDNIELNISFDNFPVFALGRNYTKDIFSSVMYQDENFDDILVRTYDNLGKSTESYFRVMAGIPPGGRYFFAIGGQYNYIEYDGFYENQPLSFTNGSWRLFTFHSLRLFDETRLTLTGFMMTNGQWNFYELQNFGMLNIGLSQTFLNRKLTVSLNARDILRTMVNEFEFNQGSISSYGSRYTDNMRFGINIRYNFGINNRQDRNGSGDMPDMDLDTPTM